MTIDQLKKLRNVTKPRSRPVLIFFADGSRWGVCDQSDDGANPFWVSVWGGRDPLYPHGEDRIGE